MIEKIRGSELSRNTAIRTIMNDAVLKQKIKSYILKNSGDASDAETIFHDAIVTFVKTVFTKKEFQLSVHWHGFMLGTARNLWMNALRKKKKHVTVSIEHASHNESGENNMNLLLKGERGRILQLVLNEMKKRCKDVLMLWASGYKMVEIATQLGYKSEGVARKKKSECMKELYTYLGNNPHIKERIRPV
ncbi:MAG: sigma-70 family RNA polymerase sigma factor [Saprospiraceae bacterium]|nr:sigma-70 family RNA polymerase sigma factor [Saprospiraceae bacterium]